MQFFRAFLKHPVFPYVLILAHNARLYCPRALYKLTGYLPTLRHTNKIDASCNASLEWQKCPAYSNAEAVSRLMGWGESKHLFKLHGLVRTSYPSRILVGCGIYFQYWPYYGVESRPISSDRNPISIKSQSASPRVLSEWPCWLNSLDSKEIFILCMFLWYFSSALPLRFERSLFKEVVSKCTNLFRIMLTELSECLGAR